MNRGIYILANDNVIDNAVALLNSVRLYDPDVPIFMIPHDNHCRSAAKLLRKLHGVKMYEDFDIIKRIDKKIRMSFMFKFFARYHLFRKFACFFGPLDEFLYIDTDIIVFEKIVDILQYLLDYDFICCDYQYKNGIKYLFKPEILKAGIISEEELKDVFNAGFWGSRKGLFSENDLYRTIEECSSCAKYLDLRLFEMPILNYLVLKRIPKRVNLVKVPTGGPGSWAGTPNFKRKGNKLFDPTVNMPLRYLHWAGIGTKEGCPYRDIWEYYRYLTPL